MRFLLFLFLIFGFISCKRESIAYDDLDVKQCDSLLRHTALNSRERALVVMRYCLLHTQGRGPLGVITSAHQDSCIMMLREVIAIAPADLQTDLKITLLPFYLSKLVSYNRDMNRRTRKLMSEIENSTLTPDQEAWYLNYKAQFYTIQRSPQEAFELCEQARKKFRKNNDKQGEFNSLSQMALLYLILKDYPAAIRYCDSAQYLEGYVPPVVDQQRLYSHYSILYVRIGEFGKAIEAFRKSGIDTIRNSTLVNLYISAGQYENALNIIDQQNEVLKDNPYRINYCLRSQAEIYEASGQYDRAAALRAEAIRFVEANRENIRKHYPKILGISLIFASVYAKQAEWVWKKGKCKEAIDLLRRAESLTLRNSNVEKEDIRILELLSQYYRETGDYRSALEIELKRDSLNTILTRKHTPVDYTEALARQEVEILKATLDKQRAELRTTRFTYLYVIFSVSLLAVCLILAILYYRSSRRIKK